MHRARGRRPGSEGQGDGGAGCEAVVDFVGEGGAVADGIAMLRRAGTYYVIGYGGTVNVPAIDIDLAGDQFRRHL